MFKIDRVDYKPRLEKRIGVNSVLTREISIGFRAIGARTRSMGCLNPNATYSFTVKPLWVRIRGENRPFSAGKPYEIVCEVVGARPRPRIIWSKGNTILRNAREMVRFKIDYWRFNTLSIDRARQHLSREGSRHFCGYCFTYFLSKEGKRCHFLTVSFVCHQKMRDPTSSFSLFIIIFIAV